MSTDIKIGEVYDYRQLIYSKIQGNKVFNFYLTKKNKVQADYIYDEKIEKNLLVNELPSNMTVSKIQNFLQRSYCNKVGHFVEIIPPLLGGWGADIHNDKTSTWAEDLGFSKAVATKIGLGCNNTDYHITRGPHNILYQTHHFNSNIGVPDMSQYDRRVVRSIEILKEAIYYYNTLYSKHGKDDTILNSTAVEFDKLWTILGSGLHPIQDMFSHTEHFVTIWHIPPPFNWFLPKEIHEHILSEGGKDADDPLYINKEKDSPKTSVAEDTDEDKQYSQRYSDTKIVTYLYLLTFLYCTKLSGYKNFDAKSINIFEKLTLSITKVNVKKFMGLILKIENDLPFHPDKLNTMIERIKKLNSTSTPTAAIGSENIRPLETYFTPITIFGTSLTAATATLSIPLNYNKSMYRILTIFTATTVSSYVFLTIFKGLIGSTRSNKKI